MDLESHGIGGDLTLRVSMVILGKQFHRNATSAGTTQLHLVLWIYGVASN